MNTFTYNDAGRLVSSGSGSSLVTYAYNALGQRVRKTSAAGTNYFIYDESHHLLGVYDSAGNRVEEIVWLGDIPVATIRTSPTGGVGFFYIHTDHLNTPVRVTRVEDNAVMWRWDHDPYGAGATDDDADGNGAFVFFNLRFPGQYHDVESALHYNYFRDYDPAVGRYVESDPIGLFGGVNTYAYVRGNPIRRIDPDGLAGVPGGGPWHPPDGVSFSCNYSTPVRSCNVRCGFSKEILSHQGWDRYVRQGGVVVGTQPKSQRFGRVMPSASGFIFRAPAGRARRSQRSQCWMIASTRHQVCRRCQIPRTRRQRQQVPCFLASPPQLRQPYSCEQHGCGMLMRIVCKRSRSS